MTAAVDATVGNRDVTFTQPAAGGGAATTAASVLVIQNPDPVLTSVAPSTFKQGQTGVIATLRRESLAGTVVGYTLYGSPNAAFADFLRSVGAEGKPVLSYVYAPAAEADRNRRRLSWSSTRPT